MTGTRCQDFGGYHDYADTVMPQFAYAVIPSCPDTGLTSFTELDYVEYAASHELIEAATDVQPLGATGYQLADTMEPWSFLGGEVGDLCEAESTTESGFTLQRVWSNSTAMRGNVNPCIPAVPGELYFNTAASPDAVQVASPGATLRFTLTGFSSAPTSDWFVTAVPGYGMFTATGSIDRPTMNNGTTATLTVHVPPSAARGSFGSLTVVSSRMPIVDSLGGAHVWPVAIAVP
jgi:hypothetical protein